jgi:hypothetical protein
MVGMRKESRDATQTQTSNQTEREREREISKEIEQFAPASHQTMPEHRDTRQLSHQSDAKPWAFATRRRAVARTPTFQLDVRENRVQTQSCHAFGA